MSSPSDFIGVRVVRSVFCRLSFVFLLLVIVSSVSRATSSCDSDGIFSYNIKGIKYTIATIRVILYYLYRNYHLQVYKYLAIGTYKSYSAKSHSKHQNKYKQEEFIQMLDILIESILVQFSGLVFEQTFSIPMGISSASLLVDSFLRAYQADVLQWFLKR